MGCLAGFGGSDEPSPAGIIVDVQVYPETIPATAADSNRFPPIGNVPFVTDAQFADSVFKDTITPTAWQPWASHLHIVALKPYRVRYRILDAAGKVVYADTAAFGYKGELENVHRLGKNGRSGSISWSLHSPSAQYLSKNRMKPGWFRWQATFHFDHTRKTHDAEVEFYLAEWPFPR